MRKWMMILLLTSALLLAAAACADSADAPLLLPQASWIWDAAQTNNHWVDFSRTFTLSSIPEQARCEIGVENKYWLTVNDRPVVWDGGLKRGPNREDGYFDVIDLAPYLTTGENTIAIRAWFWGVKDEDAVSYSSVPVDTAGLIFAADLGETVLISDEQWQTAQLPAFVDDTQLDLPQPNLRFPEYNIYYNASLEAAPVWQPARRCGRYGDAPWNMLHERPIPQLRYDELKDFADSDRWQGYTTDADEVITLALPYNAQFTPYLSVEAAAGLTISVTTENTEDAQSVRTTYVTRDGMQDFESPAWISGQFVSFHMPAGVTIRRLAWRESGYDSERAGAFAMNDAFFDALWEMGARTQYLCIREQFMDCPDRERAQWTGDAATQMRIMLYTLDCSSYSLYQKLMTQKAAWMVRGNGKGTYDDLLATVVPIFKEYYELPAQEMAGIVSLWDYYLYTGDQSILETMYELAVRYLQRWKLNKNGLVKHKTGQGLVDWQDTGSHQVDTKVQENAWYYWALRVTREMGLLLGKDVAWQEERMALVYDGYQTLWVDGQGYYGAGRASDDRGNALAVLAGLADESRYEAITGVLTTSEMASSYMEAYVLEALCVMDHVDLALDRMQRRFGPMVADNLANSYTTLWEYFMPGQGTTNHAWTGSPTYLLSKYVGGIRPTEAGYAACVIAPDFSRSDSVDCATQTIHGSITLHAVKAGDAVIADVTIPAGVAATLILPGQAPIALDAGRTHIEGGQVK